MKPFWKLCLVSVVPGLTSYAGSTPFYVSEKITVLPARSASASFAPGSFVSQR